MSYLEQIPNITLLVSSPKRGKSYAIKHMCYDLYESNRIEKIFVFSGTAFNNDYSFIPSKFLTSEYTDNKLKQIITWQKNRITNGKAKNIMIIFDDMMNLTEKLTKPFWRKLISEYRHYKISLVFSVQYIKGVGPLMRDCARYVILFKTDSRLALQSIYDCFMTEMNSIKEVKKFLNTNLKEKYTFILIDRYSNKEDKYRLLKAPDELPNYKLKY